MPRRAARRSPRFQRDEQLFFFRLSSLRVDMFPFLITTELNGFGQQKTSGPQHVFQFGTETFSCQPVEKDVRHRIEQIEKDQILMKPTEKLRTIVADRHGTGAKLHAENQIDEPRVENSEQTFDGDDENHAMRFVRSFAHDRRLVGDRFANVENPA